MFVSSTLREMRHLMAQTFCVLQFTHGSCEAWRGQSGTCGTHRLLVWGRRHNSDPVNYRISPNNHCVNHNYMGPVQLLTMKTIGAPRSERSLHLSKGALQFPQETRCGIQDPGIALCEPITTSVAFSTPKGVFGQQLNICSAIKFYIAAASC